MRNKKKKLQFFFRHETDEYSFGRLLFTFYCAEHKHTAIYDRPKNMAASRTAPQNNRNNPFWMFGSGYLLRLCSLRWSVLFQITRNILCCTRCYCTANRTYINSYNEIMIVYGLSGSSADWLSTRRSSSECVVQKQNEEEELSNCSRLCSVRCSIHTRRVCVCVYISVESTQRIRCW